MDIKQIILIKGCLVSLRPQSLNDVHHHKIASRASHWLVPLEKDASLEYTIF